MKLEPSWLSASSAPSPLEFAEHQSGVWGSCRHLSDEEIPHDTCQARGGGGGVGGGLPASTGFNVAGTVSF